MVRSGKSLLTGQSLKMHRIRQAVKHQAISATHKIIKQISDIREYALTLY